MPLQFNEAPPLGLYVHVPWCVRKCPYCDFNSHELKQALPEAAYIEALLRDLDSELPAIGHRPIQTIFIGGGTPSLLSAEAFERLLVGIRLHCVLDADAEITLEANPGTIEQRKFEEFRAVGINRLSIGVQSFADDALARLGRIHDGREAVRAAEAAHAAGFDNFNLDLMFGLPGQRLQDALRDVRNAIDLEPAHLSWYQLTLEPNTQFHARPPLLPDDDTIWAMQEQGQTLLAERGYPQYEVSAYARPERQCRHNLNYWRFGDYLGIGAGAHGKRTDAGEGAVWRRWKCKHPRDYQQTAGMPANLGGEIQLGESDLALEFLMNALRLREGFTQALFEARTGLPFDRIRGRLLPALDQGLLEHSGDVWRASPLGQRFLNDLLERFVDEQ